MDKHELRRAIARCRERGQKVAVSFCSHVPAEILLAANLCSMRVFHIDNIEDISSRILPKNICPLVAQTASLSESGWLDEVDLILAESTCDGKKKLYELLSQQEKIYYYQVPQGEDRDYVLPLLLSEFHFLIRELQRRFGIKVQQEAIRHAAEQMNAVRKSAMALMEVQKAVPPPAWGMEVYQTLEKSRNQFDCKESQVINDLARIEWMSRPSPVPDDAKRILLTGCPIGGIYQNLLGAIENNGGVVVCFENCEGIKTNRRQVQTDRPDLLRSLAESYQDTACAIMAPNTRRFSLIRELSKEYLVEGIIDISLQACHAYTVERDKMKRLSEELRIPYLGVEVDTAETAAGQLTTRMTAFIEML